MPAARNEKKVRSEARRPFELPGSLKMAFGRRPGARVETRAEHPGAVLYASFTSQFYWGLGLHFSSLRAPVLYSHYGEAQVTIPC